MLKSFLLCTAVLTSYVSAGVGDTEFDDKNNLTGDYAVYVEVTRTFQNTKNQTAIWDLFKKWEQYYRFDTDLYENDLLIMTLASANSGTAIRFNYLFNDSESIENYIQWTMMNEKLMNETGKMSNDWKTECNVYGDYKKVDIESIKFLKIFVENGTFNKRHEPASRYQFGPFLKGHLNTPADFYAKDDMIAQNIAYIAFDANGKATIGEFLREFEDYLELQGLFGKDLIVFKYWKNDIGFTGSIVYNGKNGMEAYHRANENFPNKKLQERFVNETLLVFEQVVGVNSLIADTHWKNSTKQGEDNNHGYVNLEIYGNLKSFGLQVDAQNTVSAKQIYLTVPALNLGAAYWNYDTWGSANDDWSLVQFAQLFNGSVSLFALLSSFMGGNGLLLAFAKVGILSNLATGFLVYSAELETSNTTNEATTFSYLAAGFSVLLSAFVQLGVE